MVTPGGKLEDKESPVEGACREAREEIGDCAFDGIREMKKGRTEHGWDHTTFGVPVKDSFPVKLNKEHDDWKWSHVDKPPYPIHPGVRHLIESALRGEPDDDVPNEGLGEDTLPNEKLSKTTRKDIGTVGSETRKEQPEDTFLEPGERKYPVKENGKYSHKLLIAAAREARMHGKSEIAAKADKLRAENFGGAKDEVKHDPKTGQFTSGAHAEAHAYHKGKAGFPIIYIKDIRKPLHCINWRDSILSALIRCLPVKQKKCHNALGKLQIN